MLKEFLAIPSLVVLVLTTIFVIGYSAEVGADIAVYLTGLGDYLSYVLSIFPAAIAVLTYFTIVVLAAVVAFGVFIFFISIIPASFIWLRALLSFSVWAALFVLLTLSFDWTEVGVPFRGPFSDEADMWRAALLRVFTDSLGYDVQQVSDFKRVFFQPSLATQWIIPVWTFLFGATLAYALIPRIRRLGESGEGALRGIAKVGPRDAPLIVLAGITVAALVFSGGQLKARLDSQWRRPITIVFSAESALENAVARPLFSTEKGIIVVQGELVKFYPWEVITTIDRPVARPESAPRAPARVQPRPTPPAPADVGTAPGAQALEQPAADSAAPVPTETP